MIKQRRDRASDGTPWSNEELAIAVELYVLLIRLERIEIPFNGEKLVQSILLPKLPKRNTASIRFRFRNISFVANQLGIPFLTAFSPAPQVGKNVQSTIEALLKKKYLATFSSADSVTNGASDFSLALSSLSELQDAVSDLERELVGIGHNHPPEPITDGLDSEVFADAKENLETISGELDVGDPDLDLIRARSADLIGFASKLSKWLGERLTGFFDATLKVAAPIVVAKIFGLLPLMVTVFETVVKALSG